MDHFSKVVRISRQNISNTRKRPGRHRTVGLVHTIRMVHRDIIRWRNDDWSRLARGASGRVAIVKGMGSGQPAINTSHMKRVLTRQETKPIAWTERLETNYTHIPVTQRIMMIVLLCLGHDTILTTFHRAIVKRIRVW